MGACVTPSKPKYPLLKQVETKSGSVIGPQTSAVRFVNTSNVNDSVINKAIVNQTASQIRNSNITQRPISPIPNSSLLVRPTTPVGPSEIRPIVQSILPNGNIVSNIQNPQMMIETPIRVNTGMRPIQVNQVRPLSSRINNNVLPADPFTINPTNVPMTAPAQTTVQTVQRTSANIPLPGVPGQPMILNQIRPSIQSITQTSVVRQQSRPTSSFPNPQIPQSLNQNQNQPQQFNPNPNQIIPGSSLQSLASINNSSNIPSNIQNPSNAISPQFSNIKNSIVTRVRHGDPDSQKDLMLPHIQTSPPRIQPPTNYRPLTPIQPPSVDKRLLNFDKSIFATSTKTPQLNTFTYDLDLPISGENKLKIL